MQIGDSDRLADSTKQVAGVADGLQLLQRRVRERARARARVLASRAPGPLQVDSLERHAEALASIESAVDKLAMSSLDTPPPEAALARIASLEEERVQLVASLSEAMRQRDNSVAVTSELIRQLQVREYSRPPLE
jgi:hypothetical protein